MKFIFIFIVFGYKFDSFILLSFFLQSCSRYGVGENDFSAGKIVFGAVCLSGGCLII